MIPASERRDAISVSIAGGTVLLASFMPWGQFTGRPPGGFPIGRPPVAMIINAWNGNLHPLGVQVPNSIVVLIASLLVASIWLQATRIWQAPRALPLMLAAYGCFHCLWFTVEAMDVGTLGIGSVLIAANFVWIFFILKRQPTQIVGQRHNESSGSRPEGQGEFPN